MSRSELIDTIFNNAEDGFRGFNQEGEHQVFLNNGEVAVLDRLSIEQLAIISSQRS